MNKLRMLFTVGLISASILFSPLSMSNPAYADDDKSKGFGVAISIPQAAGDSKENINNGFGFDMNYNWQKPDSMLGFRIDGSHVGFNFTDKALQNGVLANNGFLNVWGIGASVMLTPKNTKKIKPHIYGGPGFYYQYAEVQRYSQTEGYVCDPWWGCYPVTAGTTLAHESTSRLGWQGGAGLEVCFENAGSLILDVQYVSINNTHQNTEYAPLNIGYMWKF